jgi:hypothetical protein
VVASTPFAAYHILEEGSDLGHHEQHLFPGTKPPRCPMPQLIDGYSDLWPVS